MLGIITKYLIENVKVLEEETVEMGFTIDGAKTKYMVNTRNKIR